jgi:2-methylcitrate dehydratase
VTERHSVADLNERPEADDVVGLISDHALRREPYGRLALETARLSLLDALGCGLLALRFPECRRRLYATTADRAPGPGARVPGTAAVLDPVAAAFDIGCIVRWLDFNDTWLAAEWGHPSDNLGAILAVADHRSCTAALRGRPPLLMGALLHAMVTAHEIQGVLALENAFNRVGLDHVLLVRVASAAVAAALLGGDRDEVVSAVSHAFADGGALRVHRHAPNTMARKSWAAGDATSRGVRLAGLALAGEPAIPSVLTAPRWGFQDALFREAPVTLGRPLGSYVMENVLFKVSHPAEFHAQTAVEAAVALHPAVAGRWDQIARVEIDTHESAVRIISKDGPLANPADRDHCLQYMTAVALLHGDLTAESYEDDFHRGDARIDRLRARTVVRERPDFSRDYLDPGKRSIANTVRVVFEDGTATAPVTVEYPLGHPRRRAEALPLIVDKFRDNAAWCLGREGAGRVAELTLDLDRLSATSVADWMDLLVPGEGDVAAARGAEAHA